MASIWRPSRELLADAQHHGGLVGHITIFERGRFHLPTWLIKVEPPATRVLVRVRGVLVRRPVDDDRAPLRIGAARASPPPIGGQRRSPKNQAPAEAERSPESTRAQ